MPKKPIGRVPKKPLTASEKHLSRKMRALLPEIRKEFHRGNRERARKLLRETFSFLKQNIISGVSERYLRKIAMDKSLPYEVRKGAHELLEKSVRLQEKLAKVRDPIKRAKLIVSEPTRPAAKNIGKLFEFMVLNTFKAELTPEETQEALREMKEHTGVSIGEAAANEYDRLYKLQQLGELELEVKDAKNLSEEEKRRIIRYINKLEAHVVKTIPGLDFLP
ncbi:MAG: hypothetical protein J7J87_04255 [Candidatus Diapherotrites archaeon]|nr:hypothetical protein [Candidatus Diapherotrites archaeon]